MVRLFNVYHPSRTFVLACSESLLVLFSLAIAYVLLWGLDFDRVINQRAGLLQVAAIAMCCFVCLYYFDLYNFQTIPTTPVLFQRLLEVLGTALLLLAFLYYLFPQINVAQGVVIPASVILLSGLVAVRIAFNWLNKRSESRKILLIGTSPLALELAGVIRSRPELGLDLIGYIDDGEEAPGPVIPRLGRSDSLENCIDEHRVQTAIVALRDRRGRLPIDALLRLKMQGVTIDEASTAYERITGKLAVNGIPPSSLIFSDGFHVNSRLVRLQRIESLLIALVALLAASPLLILAAIAVKLDSRGPVFYRQERVGLNGRRFTLLKIRSMHVDAERQSGAVWAAINDERVTRIGHFLRRYRIDEIPQLINVLKGEMNLVGPRPERPEFVAMLQERIPYYLLRNAVRPGVTGWAQVRCGYGASVDEQHEKLQYDLFYIKNICVSLDFYIFFQTGRIVLFGRGAR